MRIKRPFLHLMVLTLLCLTGVALPAFAQNNTQSLEEALPELSDKKPVKAPQNIKDYTNQYYKNCLAQKHPILKDEHLKLMCACTASNIPDNMSVEQIKAMSTDTSEGLHQRNRMMLFVYAPCIEHPTRALVLDSCLGNENLTETMKHEKKVCNCLADGMSEYMKVTAPKFIESAIKRNINDIDPLRVLMESKSYENKTEEIMHRCVALYELGQAYQ